MNDKELADKVVALGVGEHPVMLDLKASCFQGNKNLYSISSHLSFGRWTAEVFVRDWRVAGALMEKCIVIHVEQMDDGTYEVIANKNGKLGEQVEARNESLPRAIIEACVEALS